MKKGTKSSPNVRLRNARSERGWSQQELADKIGTTPVNISRWETGSTFPTPYFRQRLRDVFDKTPSELGLVQPAQDSPLTPAEPDPVSPPAQDSPLTPAEPDLVPPVQGSRIVDIPIMRNPFFTGREDLLSLLHERLSIERAAALTQAQALYGLGGIGKTRAAAEYAFRYSDEYTHVCWVRAATRETLVADFVRLAERLELPEHKEPDQLLMIDAVKRWLAAHVGWLLILDNADDLPLAQEFLPTGHKGYILFTTRAQATGTIAASVEVEKLSLQAGTLLMLRWSKLLDMETPLEQAQATDRVAAERIVQEMDGLPLAIVQAGAYVEETGCTLSDYLSLYKTHRKELLARHSRLMLDYPETVATTWSISFKQIEQQSPAAAEVLRLCAFLAPDAIPESLLMGSAAELGGALGAGAADRFALNEALEVLRRYSLIQREGNTQMLRIHRLVQAVLRESMDQETQSAWAERTVRAVNAAFPEADYYTGKNQPAYLQSYLPHVQVCATLITQYHLHFPEAARLLYQAADFLYIHGFHPESHSFHMQALAIREQELGSGHPAVAESLNALAILARLEGNYEQAEAFHRQALTIREAALGPDHRATGASLNNLGVLYRSQGMYEQAEPLLKRALNNRELSLGPEHPETLFTFSNLAKLYLEQRKYEQAEQLLKQALATSEHVLEPEHPVIAHNLSLLARLYYEQGNFELAETLCKRAFAIIEKAFGSEHPATAERLNDLAELSFAQGRYTQAQSFCLRALGICEKLLGPEHPDTIAVRKHLTKILSKINMNHPRFLGKS